MRIREMLKGKRIWIYILLTIILVMFMVLTCKNVLSGTAESKREGYKSITDIPGVTFDIKKELSDYSTAVMEISPSMDFIDYQTYSYKNGKDTYLLFNIKSYIVIVKKGTLFSFAETGVEESLKKNSLNGIWFEEREKNPVLYSDENRYEVAVTAQVVITNAIYNDFDGILTTITQNGEEWAMFTGCSKAAQEEYADIMDYISTTFKTAEDNQTEKIEFAISSDGTIEEIQESNDIIIAEVTEEETVSEEAVSPSPEPTATEEPQLPEETNSSEPTDTTVPEQTESESTTEEQAQIEETHDTQEPKEENQSSNNHHPFMIELNQKNYERDENKVYTSNIYSMMNIGTTGYMDLYWDNGTGTDSAFIHADRIYDAEETKTLIANYCKSGESYYETFEAPPGTHFEAVEYSVNFLSKEPTYVNIMLCGMDGENLRYRGITYSGRTYDILNNVRVEGDWYVGYIAFYAVPNGCKEYALKCGSVADESTGYLAYYKIGK